jgi:hypothetical protein
MTRLLLLAIACCVACATHAATDPVTALADAQRSCREYRELPALLRTPEQDRACYVVTRVCIEELRPEPVKSYPPSYGNKIVDTN